MEQLVIFLLLWISDNSDLEYQNTNTPEVIRLSEQEFASRMNEDMLNKERESGGRKVVGIYDLEHRQIYLRQEVDLNTLEGRAILVHKLVYYLQQENGIYKSKDTINEMEYFADQLQSMYLTQSIDDNVKSGWTSEPLVLE